MAKTENLIKMLNPIIRGWANHYRHCVAKKSFSYIDHYIFKALWSWAKRRHPNKNSGWIKKRYYRNRELRQWVFSTRIRGKDGETYLDLVLASDVRIVRHTKIQSAATPYDPEYSKYFAQREARKYAGLGKANFTGA